MNILVIEDQKKTAGFLKQGLVENGYLVEVANRGDVGIERALAEDFHLIILDLLLPGKDGWEVLQTLRDAGRQTPVLVLTAVDQVAMRVKGLELGADDYLVKPFAFAELLARIKSILRRSQSGLSALQRIADLEIDLIHQTARRAGRELALTPKEFLLLSLMARRTGEVVSREQISREVWGLGSDVGSSNVVDVHVRRLRAKVDDPFPQKLIHTVRGIGYSLAERG